MNYVVVVNSVRQEGAGRFVQHPIVAFGTFLTEGEAEAFAAKVNGSVAPLMSPIKEIIG